MSSKKLQELIVLIRLQCELQNQYSDQISIFSALELDS